MVLDVGSRLFTQALCAPDQRAMRQAPQPIPIGELVRKHGDAISGNPANGPWAFTTVGTAIPQTRTAGHVSPRESVPSCTAASAASRYCDKGQSAGMRMRFPARSIIRRTPVVAAMLFSDENKVAV